MATDGPTVAQRVALQIDFYFSERNLNQDEFFCEQLGKNEGVVPNEVLLKCNRVKNITTSIDSIKEGVKLSSLVKATEDGNGFTRVTPFKKSETELPIDHDRAVIHISNLPTGIIWKDLKAQFENHVNVWFARTPRAAASDSDGAALKKRRVDPAAEGEAKAEAKAEEDKAEEDKPEEKKAEETAEGAEAGVDVSNVAVVVVNTNGRSPADILTQLQGLKISMKDTVLELALLEGDDATKFWALQTELNKKKTDRKGSERRGSARGGRGGGRGGARGGRGGGRGGDRSERQRKRRTAEESKPVKLGPKQFLGSDVISDYMKSVLSATTDGKPITAEATAVVKDLLVHHPSGEEKLKGFKEVVAGPSVEFPATRCLKVVKEDGSSHDFSWRKAMNKLLGIENKSSGAAAGAGAGAGAGDADSKGKGSAPSGHPKKRGRDEDDAPKTDAPAPASAPAADAAPAAATAAPVAPAPIPLPTNGSA